MISQKPLRILHVLDSATNGVALDMLALLQASDLPASHRLAALGHHSTGKLAALSGMDAGSVTFLHSAGWADPTGWRGLKKLIRRFEPTHVQAWGVAGAVAMCGFPGPRIATFTDLPSGRQMQVLRQIERRTWRNPFIWTASSANIYDHLISQGLCASRVRLTPPGVLPDAGLNPGETAALKKDLGISEGDGPILLAGGEGANARYDLALWTAAILQHLFPHLRTIVREDARDRANDSLERFLHVLADENMLIVAPPEVPWRRLIHAADILFVAADGPIPVGSILAAMAGGLAIVAAPNPSLGGLLKHNDSALIAASAAPRPLAAQLEHFLANPALGAALTGKALARVQSDFGVGAMVEKFAEVYQPGCVPAGAG